MPKSGERLAEMGDKHCFATTNRAQKGTERILGFANAQSFHPLLCT